MQENLILINKIIKNVEKVLIGKHDQIVLTLCGILSKGHILIEDKPGVGKTSLVVAMAKSFQCSFRRIQFTLDLMPSDITGFSIYNQKTQDFEFRAGPIMAQIILADEINRASPKTQSCLLECMEERQATIDGITYKMESPFIVMATQNPIEYIGTWELPEAQLDRFFLRIKIGYPSAEDELLMINTHEFGSPLNKLESITTADELINMQNDVMKVILSDYIKRYIISIILATRESSDIKLGASPRATLALSRAAQAKAFIERRDYVIPEDVQFMVDPILAHRLIINPNCNAAPEEILNNIVKKIKVPK